MLRHKLNVPCASFDEIVHQPAQSFSNTPFNMKGNHFRVHGTKRIHLSFHACFFFLYVVIIFLRVRHSASHFFTETHV